jgi:hypothetical protein
MLCNGRAPPPAGKTITDPSFGRPAAQAQIGWRRRDCFPIDTGLAATGVRPQAEGQRSEAAFASPTQTATAHKPRATDQWRSEWCVLPATEVPRAFNRSRGTRPTPHRCNLVPGLAVPEPGRGFPEDRRCRFSDSSRGVQRRPRGGNVAARRGAGLVARRHGQAQCRPQHRPRPISARGASPS